jgi:hypothetical protein
MEEGEMELDEEWEDRCGAHGNQPAPVQAAAGLHIC